MLYIISDTHYLHKKITTFEPIREETFRKFKYRNQEEMLYDRFNKKIKFEDIVFHLGDLALCSNEEVSKLRKLNGKKYLIKGNHDHFTKSKYLEMGYELLENCMVKVVNNKVEIIKNKTMEDLNRKFSSLKKFGYFVLSLENGQNILFSHYPMIKLSEYDSKYDAQMNALAEIYNKMNCVLNVHGHVHSKQGDVEFENLFNASVENINFEPILLDNILELKVK